MVKLAEITKSCQYIDVTDLVPEDWRRWFFGAISEDAPFSWGDNNRSMISKDRFIAWSKEVIDSWAEDVAMDELEQEKFFECLDNIPDDVYIDLEN